MSRFRPSAVRHGVRPGRFAACGLRVLATLASLAAVRLSAQLPAPVERLDQTWRLSAYAPEAGLTRQNILMLDFSADGTAWVAATGGLVRYDGYSFRRFTSADGLPGDLVRAVCVTRDQTLWVGTDKGAGTFDGKNFVTHGSEQGLAGQSVRRIIEDPDGTLWFCCDQWPDVRVTAGLTSYKDGQWKSYHTGDGLPSDAIWNYFRARDGRQFALTTKGVVQRHGERWGAVDGGAALAGAQLWEMVETPVHGIVARGADAFYVERDGEWRRLDPPNARHHGIIPPLSVTRDNEILTGDFDGFSYGLARWTGTDIDLLRPLYEGYDSNLQYIREAPDGSIWFCSYGLLSRWERLGGEWREYQGLPQPKGTDRFGAIWFQDEDTDSIYRSSESVITLVPDALGTVTFDGRSDVWVHGAESGLLRHEGGAHPFTEAQCGLARVTRHVVDARGVSWFDGEDSGGHTVVSRYDGNEWSRATLPDFGRTRIRDNAPDPISGVWYLLAGDDPASLRCIHVDGDRTVASVNARFESTTEGSLYLVVGHDGVLWLSGSPGLYRCDPRKPEAWEPVQGAIGRDVGKGVNRGDELWFPCASWTGGESGFVTYRNNTWTSYSSGESELLATGPDGTLYAGTEHAVNIVPPGSDRPTQLSLPSSQQIRGLVKSAAGDLWLGVVSEDGGKFSVFHYRADGIPPRTFLDAPREVRNGRMLAVKLTAAERFVPSRKARTFQHSWRFDAQPWSAFQAFPADGLDVAGLAPGEHRLQVRTRDEGGDIEPVPVELPFTVLPVPLQERPWFKPAVLALFTLILGLAAFAAERARRFAQANTQLQLAHENLEHRVAQRTAELSRSNDQLAAEVAEREHAQEELLATQGRLFETSRAAGMAEVATSVLHNVGNVLNSVNVATDIVIDRLHVSQVSSLEKLAALLREQEGDLARFLAEDPRGRHVPEFIQRLATALVQERQGTLTELAQLQRHVAHIKQIVAMQQTYAKVSGVAEKVPATEIVEDALRINAATIDRQRIEVVREFLADPVVEVERHKALQILVNLIRNAEHACEESGRPGGRITISVLSDGDEVVLSVTDNGVGIAPGNLTRIFGQGFTTRKHGHGFGLHSGALAANEMGGSLKVSSPGPGQGATFTLRLPLERPPARVI